MIGIAILSLASAAVPAAFRGDWADSRYGCSSGALHTRFTIRHAAFDTGEFQGRIITVRRISARRIDVVSLWEFDGEQQRNHDVLNLSPDQQTLFRDSSVIGALPDVSERTQMIRCR
jgi:hypothetical protein